MAPRKRTDRKQVVQELAGALKFAAQRRALVTYKELAVIAGLPQRGSFMGKEIGSLLGEISAETYQRHRVLISSIVIHTRDGSVGEGFFRLARYVGAIKGRLTKYERAGFLLQSREATFRKWSIK